MAQNNFNINDKFCLKDNLAPFPGMVNNGLWAKTEIIGGYGDVIDNPIGKSTLGEVTFRQHNIVPIGGVSYVMQNVFGIPETQITIPTLYDETGIGNANTTSPSETYLSPDGPVNVQYRYGHFTQLFGIGITGTGENDVTVYHPDYREKSINMSKVNPDGLTITGTMLPFRYTAESLSSKERRMYFGKKVDSKGITAYYLKRFEQEAKIKHIWKTGEDVENETLVSPSDVWENASGMNAVESFTEIFLKITKKDVKEWFISLEQEDRTRINTIALFNGRFSKDPLEVGDLGDYEDVRLFSKFCMNPEYLTLNKDFNIIYRIYGA